MKIFDAVYTAAIFLQLDEISDGMTSSQFNVNNPKAVLGEEDAKELELLIRCCNLVLHELSETGFPLKGNSELEVKDGKIFYGDLDRMPSEIISVRKEGKSIPFRAYYDCITVRVSGKCEIEYTFEPKKADLGGEAEYLSSKPSARLVAYGIAREYCLISGMTDEAAMWDSRFSACLEDEATEKREKKVRARVWR